MVATSRRGVDATLVSDDADADVDGEACIEGGELSADAMAAGDSEVDEAA
jgi:hypothetical protein